MGCRKQPSLLSASSPPTHQRRQNLWQEHLGTFNVPKAGKPTYPLSLLCSEAHPLRSHLLPSLPPPVTAAFPAVPGSQEASELLLPTRVGLREGWAQLGTAAVGR